MPKTKQKLKKSRSAGFGENLLNILRHCFCCGSSLKRRYVKEEKHWRHVCTGCARISYLNPKVVAGTIPRLPTGKIILLRRNIEPALGKWSYPAGYQELGESVAQAARRETLEEIGVRIRVEQPLGIYSYEAVGVVTIVYLGSVLNGEKPRVTSEAMEVKAFAPEQIPWEDLAFRSTADALRDWIDSLNQAQKTSSKISKAGLSNSTGRGGLFRLLRRKNSMK